MSCAPGASSYLSPKDYPQFGLAPTTPADKVVAASALIDQMLNRPEGLVWMPDAAGVPAYMAAKTPTMAYTLGQAIAPGANVVVGLTPAYLTADLIGEVLVLDRGNSSAVESCVVSAIDTTAATVTLARVKFAHAQAASAEVGLVLFEERPVAAKRQISRISRTPCVAMLAMQGRYGYGRRSDQIAGRFQSENLLAMVQPFGGPVPWLTVDPAQAAISPTTGDVYVPVGLYLSQFSEVRMRYVAGYAAGAVPNPIKTACAQIAQALQNSDDSGISSQIKMYKAGNQAFTRFSESDVPADTKAMIKPYKALSFY